MPVRLTASSRIRRRRVMSRGEPGGRLKPRAFSALASESSVTVPRDRARSRITATISSCGAVCGSDPAATNGFGAGCGCCGG